MMEQLKSKLLKDIDACIVLSKTNRFFLCGYISSNGIVVITKNNNYFLTDFRYKEEAEEVLKSKGYVVVECKSEELQDTLNYIFYSEGIKTAGVEEEVYYSEYKKIIGYLENFEIKNLSPILCEMRSVKTNKELKIIRQAQDINDRTFLDIKEIVKPGITERDLSVELKYRLLKNGADDFAFEPIVAFGKNTSKPHSSLSGKLLESGELIMLDFGAKYQNYCSDMTRMLCLGKPTDEDAEFYYNLVLRAQSVALDRIKENANVKEIDGLVRGIFANNGCEQNFGHGLGHGVGLDIHEYPNVKSVSEDVFKTNMVVTVEPGLYFTEKFGIRIEDLVVITKEGIENLTKSEKNLVI